MECGAVLALGLAIRSLHHLCRPCLRGVDRLWVRRGLHRPLLPGPGLWTGSRPKLVSLAIGSLFLGARSGEASYLVAGAFVVTGRGRALATRSPRAVQHPVRMAVALPRSTSSSVSCSRSTTMCGSDRSASSAPRTSSSASIRHVPVQPALVHPARRLLFLLSPARYLSSFPFIYLRTNTFSAATYLQSYQNEPVAGILTNMPVITVGLVMALAGARRLWRKRTARGTGHRTVRRRAPGDADRHYLHAPGDHDALRAESRARFLLLATLVGWQCWNRMLRPGPCSSGRVRSSGCSRSSPA